MAKSKSSTERLNPKAELIVFLAALGSCVLFVDVLFRHLDEMSALAIYCVGLMATVGGWLLMRSEEDRRKRRDWRAFLVVCAYFLSLLWYVLVLRKPDF